MKRQKSIGLRIILGIAGIAVGLVVQVVGALLGKVLPGLELIFVLIGFVVMGICVYKWAIK